MLCMLNPVLQLKQLFLKQSLPFFFFFPSLFRVFEKKSVETAAGLRFFRIKLHTVFFYQSFLCNDNFLKYLFHCGHYFCVFFLCFIVGVVMFRKRFNPLYTESGPDLWVKHKTKKIFHKIVLAFFRYLVIILGV